MTPRVATALANLRQHMAAEVVFDGDVLVIVKVDPELTGSPYLVIDETQVYLSQRPTGRPTRRDHLRAVQ